METLTLKSNRVELAVNGDPQRVLSFDPYDVGFAAGFYSLAEGFTAKEQEYRSRAAALEAGDASGAAVLLQEICAWLGEQIDQLFGQGTCQTVFGESRSLGLYQQFFEGVVPYIRKAREDQLESYIQKDEGVMR